MLNSLLLLFGEFSAIMFIFGFFIFNPLLSAFTVPYFDKKYEMTLNYWNYPANAKITRIGRWFFLGGQYGTLIVFRRGMKKSIDRTIFGGFDFRIHARTIDKIFAFGFVILGMGGLCLAAIISILLQLLSLIN